jgi:hypothetical protein
LAAVVSVAPGVTVLEAEAFVDAAAAAGLGAVCARDGALELFWGAAAVVIVSAITAAIEIAG